MDIRQQCWTRLTESLSNAMKVYLHLRDEASSLLAEEEDAQAATQYVDNILTAERLEEIGVSGDYLSAPNLDDLRTAVDEIGIREFRGYIDTQINYCKQGQERLDMLIDNRFSPGGEDPFLFEASVGNLLDDDLRVTFLKDAYIWAKGLDGYILTRCDSDIHSQREEIHGCMKGERFEIVCPDDYG